MSERSNTEVFDAALADDLIPDRALIAGDKDAFNHAAIAAALARHVIDADRGLNIALYGPWGSGKSSIYELLRRKLEGRSIKIVRYDAWRFGGHALRRNFISHAATELGFPDSEANRRFHRGLYENERTAAIALPDVRLVAKPLAVFVALLVTLVVIVALIAWGISYFTANNPTHEVGIALTKLTAPAAVVAVLAASLKAVIDGASVQIEQSRPSEDEQFTQRFEELVSKAREKHGVDRLVFYVDELDRCAPDDVVATLSSLKTFLDQEDCVFIVAADRQVLERALKLELRQATPADEEDPYYSSASSFLDKVFHHQFFLPPLRSRSLTHFARELLEGRAGVWGEIREHGGQRALDRVIYALVPSHVVSPRRLKVLLNNFATNARTAQERGIPWIGRSSEVAKLTVLQTEFPLLGADLQHEPRLPDFILAPPEHPSDRVQRLLARHGITYADDVVSEGSAETDELLIAVDDIESADGSLRVLIQETQTRDLKRYLQRAASAGIEGPGRDLLFLEPAGRIHGLKDMALSEAVERDAREDPLGLIKAISERSVEEKIAVIHMLADIADEEFGIEQENAVQALLAVVDGLGDDVRPIAPRVCEAVRSYLVDGDELTEQQLLVVLRVALAARRDGQELVSRILEDDVLYQDSDNVAELGRLLPRLPKARKQRVVDAIADHARALDVLVVVTEELPEGEAKQVWMDTHVRAAVSGAYETLASEQGSETADQYADAIYQAVLRREKGAAAVAPLVQSLFLGDWIAYSVVLRYADQVLSAMPPGAERNEAALRGLAQAEAGEWEPWSRYLTVEAGRPPRLGGVARAALVGLISSHAQTARCRPPRRFFRSWPTSQTRARTTS